MSLARAARFLLAILCTLPVYAGPRGPAEMRLKELVETQKKLFAKAEAAGDAFSPDDLQASLQQLCQQYDVLLNDHKEFAPTYVAYGLLLGKAGMRKQSVAMLLRANQLDRDLPLVKNQLGNFLVEDGRPLEAINYYLAAIKLAPDEPLYHFQIGLLLNEARDDFLKSNDWNRAKVDETMHDAFERATTLAPDDWRYAYHYGLSFYELQTSEWEAALQFWESFEKRLKPGVEQQVCQLHQAKVLGELRRFDEADKQLDAVTEPALAEQKKKVARELSAAIEKAKTATAENVGQPAK